MGRENRKAAAPDADFEPLLDRDDWVSIGFRRIGQGGKNKMLKARANMRLKTLHGAETAPSRATRELQRRPPTSEPAVRSAGLLDASTATPTDALGQVRFLRLPEVKAITGLGKTSIYEQIREKSFPAPVRLGLRAVGWVESEVRQWAQERVHESRPAA